MVYIIWHDDGNNGIFKKLYSQKLLPTVFATTQLCSVKIY